MRSVIILLSIFIAALAAPPPPSVKKPFGSMDWDRYWSLDEIEEYMFQLEADRPEICAVEIMGTTAGERYIRGLRVANTEILQERQLPIIFVTAGASARDWISVMSALNIMHELVEHYEDFGPLVDHMEWFILPVANPDGYEFSRTEGQRAWIKNRSVNEGSDCIGVNIERNFAFNWGLDSASSSDPCSSNFRGTRGDSEEETITIQFANDLFRGYQRAYITIRAGSVDTHSTLAIPYSSNNEWFANNFQNHIGIGNIMTHAIFRETGARYRVTSEANAAGIISGTSGDYALGQDSVPFAYTLFAPRGGNNGWDVPEAEINHIVNELFTGVRVLAEHLEATSF